MASRNERAAWEALVNRDKAARPTSARDVIAGQDRPGWLEASSKFGNKATTRDGIRFHSKLEADRYSELKLLQHAGRVSFFLRQVPFHVAPGVVWRADFVVFSPAAGMPPSHEPLFLAGVTVEDTKGVLTAEARVKIKTVEDRYGIRVRILKRGDVQRFAA